MKTSLLLISALTALAALSAACNSGKSTETASVPDTVIEDDPGESLVEPVTTDATRDTVLTLGAETAEMTVVDRIYHVSNDCFLSVSLTVPHASSQITAAMTALVDSNFVYFTDTPAPQHPAATTPASLGKALTGIGKTFTSQVIPEASRSGSPYFNITLAAAPVYADGRYMTYQIFAYAYTGGAHGQTVYNYSTYDTASGIKLSLNDIVPAAQLPAIRRQIVDALAERYNMTPAEYLTHVSEYLYPDDATPLTPDTFPIDLCDVALVAQGYVFSFPEITIAPYSDGNIIVTIPRDAEDNQGKNNDKNK